MKIAHLLRQAGRLALRSVLCMVALGCGGTPAPALSSSVAPAPPALAPEADAPGAPAAEGSRLVTSSNADDVIRGAEWLAARGTAVDAVALETAYDRLLAQRQADPPSPETEQWVPEFDANVQARIPILLELLAGDVVYPP